jgi:8-oxo-dGTP pyrophosphatase MutT (NUDIX family)
MGTRRSAGIVVVRRRGETWHFLLLRAYGYWDFPKGGIESGETSLDAAIRETREETALTELEFRWGEVWIETEPYAGGKVVRYHLAECSRGDVRLDPSPETGRPEHHEYRWLPLEPAKDLLVPRLRRVLAWANDSLSGVAPSSP